MISRTLLLVCFLVVSNASAATNLRTVSKAAPKFKALSTCEEESKQVGVQIVHESCDAHSYVNILSQDKESVTVGVSNKHPDSADAVHFWRTMPTEDDDKCLPTNEPTPIRLTCIDGMAILDIYQQSEEDNDTSSSPCQSACHVQYAIQCSPSKCATGGKRLGSSHHEAASSSTQ